MNLADRIKQARLDLMLDFPFWGTLIARLTCIEDDSVLCPCTGRPTACTDGKVIRYHPQLGPYSRAELAFLVAHEVGHPAFGHLWRRGHRDPVRWNQACDYALNLVLAEVSAKAPHKLSLPKDVLLDYAYHGLSAEEIYERLPQEPAPRYSPGQFTDPPPEPKPSGTPGTDGTPTESLQQEWQAAAVQAANAERQRNAGTIAAGIERLVDEVIQSKISWIDHLREFCHRLTRDDYSWSRPNRRYLHSGFCLPSLRSKRLGPLVIVIDSSGSISRPLLTEFMAEMQAVLEQCRPEALHVLDCDSSIHQHAEFQPGDDVTSFRVLGGGGTRFDPAFRYVEEHQLDPVALIYFTDLDAPFPAAEPSYPVLWAAYNTRRAAPWGQTIKVIPN